MTIWNKDAFRPTSDGLDFFGGLIGTSNDLDMNNRDISDILYKSSILFDDLEKVFNPTMPERVYENAMTHLKKFSIDYYTTYLN